MATTLQCPHCKQETATGAPAGKQTKCRKCQAKFRVPLAPSGLAGVEFECPECGQQTRSAAAPGKKTTCRSCQAKIRVPLRDHEEAEADEPQSDPEKPALSVRRTCPECGAKVPGAKRFCPKCETDMDAALHEQRYGHLEGEDTTLLGAVRYYGLPGGVLGLVGALVWLAAGLAEGVIFPFALALSLFSLAVIVDSLLERRRRA